MSFPLRNGGGEEGSDNYDGGGGRRRRSSDGFIDEIEWADDSTNDFFQASLGFKKSFSAKGSRKKSYFFSGHQWQEELFIVRV